MKSDNREGEVFPEPIPTRNAMPASKVLRSFFHLHSGTEEEKFFKSEPFFVLLLGTPLRLGNESH